MGKPRKTEYYDGPKAATSTDCCPFCNGKSGYKGSMTETHLMTGGWGKSPTSAHGAMNVKWGAFFCQDCGKKFRCLKDLTDKGLAQ